MVEFMLAIILTPIAILAAIITFAFGVGVIKSIFNKSLRK